MLMNLRDKNSAQFILLHKQHFDHKLIELLESLKLQNEKLRQENDYLRASCQNLKTISASLKAQIDSLKREAKAESPRSRNPLRPAGEGGTRPHSTGWPCPHSGSL